LAFNEIDSFVIIILIGSQAEYKLSSVLCLFIELELRLLWLLLMACPWSHTSFEVCFWIIVRLDLILYFITLKFCWWLILIFICMMQLYFVFILFWF